LRVFGPIILQNNVYTQTVARCMQVTVRVKAYQNTFFDLGVITS